MHAAVLMAVLNPYHPPKDNHAPLDVLLVTIGLVIIILLICVPAHLARGRELRQLEAQQPPPVTEPEATAAPH
jgi:hypothetical protein